MKPWVAIPCRTSKASKRGLYYALVDRADLPLVEDDLWFAYTNYAQKRLVWKGKSRLIYMHRILMNAQRGQIVDHINGDTMDNRRSNLRFASAVENVANTRSRNRYRGISEWGSNHWVAQCKRGEQLLRAHAETPEEAARLYDGLARQLYGEFARVNFPAPGELPAIGSSINFKNRARAA